MEDLEMKKSGLFKRTALLCGLLLTFLLTACGSQSPSDLIVGRWAFEEDITTGFEFFSDGEAIGFNGDETESADWSISEDTLKLTNPYGDDMLLMDIEELTEDRLVLSIEGQELVLIKESD